MNELERWRAILAAAQTQGRQDLVQRAQAEIARLETATAPETSAPNTEPSAASAFGQGALGAVTGPLQAVGDLMKSDVSQLPGKLGQMAVGTITGVPELLRRALGPGAEETRDPALFMGKGGIRTTMPPAVAPNERASALGTLSVLAAAPAMARSPGVQTGLRAGIDLPIDLLQGAERALFPRRALTRMRLDKLLAQMENAPSKTPKQPMGLTAEDVAAQNARVVGRIQPSAADLAAIEARRQAALAARPATPTPTAAPPVSAAPAAPAAGGPATYGTLALKPGGVLDEAARELQGPQGMRSAAEILRGGAGAPAVTQPPNTLVELLKQAGPQNPFTPTAGEASAQQAIQALRAAAEEHARTAYNLVFEATGDKAKAIDAARRAAGFHLGGVERTGGL